MIIKEITIKGMRNMQNKTIRFETGVNYFFGPNGVGKSTILNAIQLIILGYIPGKPKTNKSIIKNSNGNVIELSAKFDAAGTEVSVSRMWVKKGQSVTSDMSVNPITYDIESLCTEYKMPIFNFDEFVAMSENMQKDYFISHLISSKDSKDILTELVKKEISACADVKVKKKWESALQSLDTPKDWNNPVTLDAVKDAEEWVKDMLSFKNGDMKRIVSTIQSLIKYDDIDDGITEDMIQIRQSVIQKTIIAHNAYTDQLNHYNEYQGKFKQYSDIIERYKDIQHVDQLEEVNSYNEASEAYRKLCAEQEEAKQKLTDELLSIQKSIMDKQAQANANLKILESKGVCNFTGKPCESIANSLEKLSAENEKIASEIKELESQYDKVESDRGSLMSEEVESAKNAVTVAQENLRNAQNSYNQVQNLINNAPSKPESIGEVNIDALTKELLECTDSIAKIKANKMYESTYDKLDAEKSTTEFQIDVLKVLKKYLGPNGLQQKLSEDGFIEAAKELKDVMYGMFDVQEGVEPAFLIASAANSFSFGLTTTAGYIPFEYLSKGERCLYMISFMAYVMSKDVGGVNVLLVDDAIDHLDIDASERMFKCIQAISDKLGIQCIFAGVNEPPEEHEGINCIKMD